MVEVHVLTGYKSLVHDDQHLRDNFTYLSLTCNDWKHDQDMIRFLVNEHHLQVAPLIKLISQLVQDNRTPQLHITLWQHSIETGGRLECALSTKEPVLVNWNEQMITAFEYIKGKKAYYDNLAALEERRREKGREYERKAAELRLERANRKAKKTAPPSDPIP
jgi:hypothetical protein